MKKNGFTLIELLAVIVILAIIAVIATPIIVGIIEDSRKAAFERSVEGILHATDIDFGTQNVLENYEYELTNGVISNMDIPVKNIQNFNGTIKYDENGNSEYAIHNNKWCMIKTTSGTISTTEYAEDSCNLKNYTSKNCFAFEDGTITDYYDYENNDSSNPACPRDVVIPNTINGIAVTKIGDYAFRSDCYYDFYNGSNECSSAITSVQFPNSLEEIGKYSFRYNLLSGILDLSNTNLKFIGGYAFAGDDTYSVKFGVQEISVVKLPKTIESIEAYAFLYSPLESVTFYGRSNLDGVSIATNAWSWATDHNEANSIFFNNTTE